MNGTLLWVAAAEIALLAAGLATGAGIYYVLAALLLLMAAFALLSALLTLFTVRVSMKGARGRVQRGERLMTILTVRHSSVLPVREIGVRLVIPGGGRQELTVQAAPFVENTYRNVIRCPHRGCFDVGVDSVAVRDLFGMFSLSRKQKKPLLRVEVSPKPRETECMRLKNSDMGAEFVSAASEDNASPSDIRAWQDGDELKRVHWKLSLRRREMIVRTYESSARPDTLIVPDLTALTALTDQRLAIEDAICEASLGAAKAQLEGLYPVCMPLQSARPREVNGRSAQDYAPYADALTRVRFDCPYRYDQVLLQLTQRLQRTGGVILSTANLTTQTADIALRILRMGVTVRINYIADSGREDVLELLEMLKMAGASVAVIDPWETKAAAGKRA